MSTPLRTLFLASLLALGSAPFARAQPGADPDAGFDELDRDRRAQTGMKFLSFAVDPRAAALGGAATAFSGSSAALFNNPAGMARVGGVAHVALARTEWATPDVAYSAGAFAFRPAAGRYGVFGVHVVSVDYGEFLGTIRADNAEGFLDTGTFSPTSLVVGGSYARALTDRFAIGGTVKYAHESLGESVMGFDDAGAERRQDNAQGVAAFDFGVLYATGFRSLDFAASIRNFAQEITYERENLELPLTFQIGVSMDLLDLTALDPSLHSLHLAVDASRPRDFDEQVRLGAEYTFMDTFSLRAGYAAPADEQGLSLGAGVDLGLGATGLAADYAFTRFGDLGDLHRVGLQFGL